VEAFFNYYEDFMKITRLYEDISREMKASIWKCGDFTYFTMISIIFLDFLEKLRLFQGLRGFFPNVSMAFIKPFSAEAF
jgi:hypothetical protein